MTSENEKLVALILAQVTVGNLDWEVIRHGLGLNSAATAQKRWSRYKKTLPALGNLNNSPVATPKRISKTTPKKIRVEKTPTSKKKSKPTSIKSEMSDGESEAEIDDDNVQREVMPETPSRRMPSRKARVMTLKDVDSGYCGNVDEETDSNVGQDSDAE